MAKGSGGRTPRWSDEAKGRSHGLRLSYDGTPGTGVRGPVRVGVARTVLSPSNLARRMSPSPGRHAVFLPYTGMNRCGAHGEACGYRTTNSNSAGPRRSRRCIKVLPPRTKIVTTPQVRAIHNPSSTLLSKVVSRMIHT